MASSSTLFFLSLFLHFLFETIFSSFCWIFSKAWKVDRLPAGFLSNVPHTYGQVHKIRERKSKVTTIKQKGNFQRLFSIFLLLFLSNNFLVFSHRFFIATELPMANGQWTFAFKNWPMSTKHHFVGIVLMNHCQGVFPMYLYMFSSPSSKPLHVCACFTFTMQQMLQMSLSFLLFSLSLSLPSVGVQTIFWVGHNWKRNTEKK